MGGENLPLFFICNVLFVCFRTIKFSKYHVSVSEDKTLTPSGTRPHAYATHVGYLMKKGATFKLWKPRWFVLDCSKHQVTQQPMSRLKVIYASKF